jgi:hypothetical protein
MTKQEPIYYEENFNSEECNLANLEEENVSFIPRNFEVGGGEVI